MSSFVISCGGTGGHLAPGISLAQSLLERKHKCWLLISNKTIDARLIKKYPEIKFVCVPGVALSFKPLRFLKFCYYLLSGFVFNLKFLSSHKPSLVIGFGGFISAGVGLASLVLGYPLVLHEANHQPGRAIRLLAPFAQRVYLPSGVKIKNLAVSLMRHYGYPVRSEIRCIPKKTARQNLGIDRDGKLLVIIGGSQGARSLNDWVLKHFERLGAKGISIYCISGLSKVSQGTLEVNSVDGRNAKVYWVPFSDRMSSVYSSADLVVSRAGAGSIAEIVRCQVPSILIPYPYAADNHQLANARFMEQHGAALVLEQKRLDHLSEEVIELIFNEWLLENFRQNLQKLDRKDCLERITLDLEHLAAHSQRYTRPKSGALS